MSYKTEKIDGATILARFRRAFEFKKKWIEEAQKDYLFAMGKQWEDKDKEELERKGVLALTINKIKPNIMLLTGIESQNRADIMAFPEGKERGIMAEIATGLIKNVTRTSGLNFKRSEQFKDGITCGESYLEPFIDYTFDIINGDMKFKKCAYNSLYPEPGFEEYDLSDAGWVCKVTFDLTKDQVLGLFPDKEKEVNALQGNGKLSLDGIPELRNQMGLSVQKKQYNDSTVQPSMENLEEPTYDLLEHYYKHYVKQCYVVFLKRDPSTGRAIEGEIKRAKDKAEAEFMIAIANKGVPADRPAAQLMERMVPEIWRASIVGGMQEILEDGPAPTYPEWSSFPFIPFFAERRNVPVKENDRHLLVQGIVRGMRDLNIEFNKRRTQEMRILNSSANSGWQAEEGAMVDPKKWETFGSTPGVVLEHKIGRPMPQKIQPTQLSQGHAQLAAENSGDMKESSGINAEQLALESGEQSGRAIALRQKQGLVMVQHLFDNLSQTNRILGRFILSQLGKIFDVGEAIKVMGDGFINDNFMEPVLVDGVNPVTGAPEKKPQLDQNGQLLMQVNQERVVTTFNQVLNDVQVGKFEVAVGESVSSETTKYANYLMLMEMMEKGLPIPGDVLVDESLLSESSKEKIRAAIQAQQQAMQAQPPAGGKK